MRNSNITTFLNNKSDFFVFQLIYWKRFYIVNFWSYRLFYTCKKILRWFFLYKWLIQCNYFFNKLQYGNLCYKNFIEEQVHYKCYKDCSLYVNIKNINFLV